MKASAKLKLPALILIAGLVIGCAPAQPATGDLTMLTFPPTGAEPDTTTSPAPDNTTSAPETTTAPELTTGTTENTETDPPSTPSDPEPDPFTAEILAVGDNLFHSQLINQGNRLGYDTLYAGMADLISSADLAIINQETVFTTGTPSTYPSFATPTAVGDAAIRAGFDVFSCATNHTWDKGTQGILDTLEYFAAHPEVTEVGLNNTLAERNRLDVVEVNGISIAIFNYGTLINTKSESWWRGNYLDKTADTAAWIQKMIAKAKEETDFVIVCAHWGNEYEHTPNDQETYWAKFFADCGVDLIIGTHPHVVQPVEEIEGKDGNKTLVYYSLGNFLHAQNDMNANVGGLAKVRLYKDDDGKVSIVGYDLLATTVDCQVVDGVQCYVARLLSDITDEMLKSSWKWGDKNVTVADFEAIFEEAISSHPNQTPAAA